MVSKEKVRLDISLPGAYLTGLPNVLAALGLPSDLAAIFIKLHTFSGKDLVPGESTLRRAKLHGYSKSTIEKLTKPFDINPEEIEFSKKETQLFERAAKVRSPMPQWWGLKSFLNETPEFRLLWQFIEQRIYNDIAIREVALSGQSSSNIRDPIVKLEFERISQLIIESPYYKQSLTAHQFNELSRIASEMDFYFSLLAHFEVGFKRWHYSQGFQPLRRSQIVESINSVNFKEKDRRNFFESYLNLLRTALGKRDGCEISSWRQLASHLHQPDNDYREGDLNDQQYKVIKDWRSASKNQMPGDGKLYSFLVSINGSEDGADYLFLHAKIALFFDAHIEIWRNQLAEIGLADRPSQPSMLDWLLAYESYYASCIKEYWPAPSVADQ